MRRATPNKKCDATPTIRRQPEKRYPRTGKRGAPQVFPRKVHEILTNESADIVTWNAAGTTFRIMDMETFTRTLGNIAHTGGEDRPNVMRYFQRWGQQTAIVNAGVVWSAPFPGQLKWQLRRLQQRGKRSCRWCRFPATLSTAVSAASFYDRQGYGCRASASGCT